MTPEEMAALIESLMPKVNESINAAITSHTKRLQKDFETKLEAVKPAPAPEKETPAPQGGKNDKLSPELAAYQAKLEDALKQIKASDDARKAAEDKARDASAYTQLKEHLKAVRPDMIDIAAERLFHVQKRITYGEDGTPLFKVKRAPIPGMAEEDVELPLEAGIEQWLKSKDASPFVAAPASGGPGGRGGKSPLGVPSGRHPNGLPKYDSPATTDDERIARAAETEAAMRKAIEQGNF